jgi:peroxiredoxin
MQSVKIDRFLRLSILALTGVFAFIIYAAIHERVVAAGDTAPDFNITADSGQTVSVSHFTGKLLVLNFWATWCSTCVEETPSLSKFAQDYASKGVTVLAVSVDKDENAYRKFLQKFQPGFLTARELKLHEDYGTYQYPETYLIDSKGKVVLKIADPADWSDPRLTHYIDTLLL